MKNMRELINLMEGVMAVPGLKSNIMKEDESDMQTASTVGRDQSYSSFDASQGQSAEEIDETRDEDDDTRKPAFGQKDWDRESEMTGDTYAKYRANGGTLTRKQWEEDQDIAESIELGDNTSDAPGWFIIRADGFIGAGPYDTEQEAVSDAKRLEWFSSADGDDFGFGHDVDGKFVDDESGDEADDLSDEYSDGEPMGSFDFQDDADALASAGHGSDEDYGDFPMDEARSSDINPEEVKALATMQVDAAKARAQEIIAASTTSDNKKSYLMNQINRARNAMDVTKLMYNMILAGEGNAVGNSSYGKKFNSAVREEVTADDIDLLTMQYRSGQMTYDEFRDKLDALEHTDNSMRQGEMGMMGNDTPQGNRNWARDRDDYDYDQEDEWDSDMHGEIHNTEDPHDIDDPAPMEEDINNGYDTQKYAQGKDYFPNGADSPVTDMAGPSGARQGDNPEQKKMQVAETHRELVYAYRKFLKESASIPQKKN